METGGKPSSWHPRRALLAHEVSIKEASRARPENLENHFFLFLSNVGSSKSTSTEELYEVRELGGVENPKSDWKPAVNRQPGYRRGP
eukprot:336897-Pyramimonas_sp.AAC.1